MSAPINRDRCGPQNGSVHARCALKADPIDGAALHIIQAPKREPRMVRYELTDYEWAAIRRMLPNKARGVRRGTIDVSSTASAGCCDHGAPWRDLPVCYGPCTTCYNRFVRWRRAGVWGRIMDSLAAAHDADRPNDRHVHCARASARRHRAMTSSQRTTSRSSSSRQ